MKESVEKLVKKGIEYLNEADRLFNRVLCSAALTARQGNLEQANMVVNMVENDSIFTNKKMIITWFYRNTPLVFDKSNNSFNKTKRKKFMFAVDSRDNVKFHETLENIRNLAIFNLPIFDDVSSKWLTFDIDEIFNFLICCPQIVDKLSMSNAKNIDTERALYSVSDEIAISNGEFDLDIQEELFTLLKLSKIFGSEQNTETALPDIAKHNYFEDLISFGNALLPFGKFGLAASKTRYHRHDIRKKRRK